MNRRAGTGMRIGYACVNTRLPSAARTVRLANATPERLRWLTAANLDALEAILRGQGQGALGPARPAPAARRRLRATAGSGVSGRGDDHPCFQVMLKLSPPES